MKFIIGSILGVLGFFAGWVCGLGIFASVIVWLLSILGLPLVEGIEAGPFIFKFAGGWLLGVVFGFLGSTMVLSK